LTASWRHANPGDALRYWVPRGLHSTLLLLELMQRPELQRYLVAGARRAAELRLVYAHDVILVECLADAGQAALSVLSTWGLGCAGKARSAWSPVS